MEEAKKHKTRTAKEHKAVEPKVHVTYNELRAEIVDEVNAKFDSPKITSFEKSQEDSITVLMAEFEEDTEVPKDLDLLYNYNASINILIGKWLKKHVKYSHGLEKNNRRLEALEAMMTQEYKRNPLAHNGLLLNDKEIRNIILISPEHIELVEKINNIKAVISVIEMAISRLKDMSFTIKNALETLRIKHFIVNGNI